MQEIIWPVTTSTTTTVVVFLPLGLLEGVAGQFFKTLSITIAVLVSLGVAFTIIPLLADQFITEGDADMATSRWRNRANPLARLLHHIGHAIDTLSERYERSLARIITHPR